MRKIDTVTIVGANGTMGRNIAAIFAAFGKAKVYLVSRNIEKSVIAQNKAYLSVKAESVKERMIPSDYAHLAECIKDSDLILEACAEKWEIKKKIHEMIVEALDDTAKGKVFCSGTSGLSITKLSEIYPEEYRESFMGMHFFNPPYQMTLCEMIPTKYSQRNRRIFDEVKEYAEKILYRTVVETADAPAFLGNRIGFQFINEALQIADRYKYNGGIDYIDAIMGPFTGRNMPPLVTANFVGLDVHKAIVDNLYENSNDYAHDTFILPEFVESMITDGRIGRKSGAGLYKTIIHDNGMKSHQVYDITHGTYRESMKYTFPFAEEMVEKLAIGDYEAAFLALIENQSQEAKICCELLLKYILYSLNAANELDCAVNAADDVMATGFRWCPPLALYEAFSKVADFKVLCMERLDKNIIGAIEKKDLFNKIEKSKYDFRKFMIAKK